VRERWIEANGVFGLYPAAQVGDDIEIYADRSAARPGHLAQPAAAESQAAGPRELCLADFVAPRRVAGGLDRGLCGVRRRIDERVRRFEAAHDDYNAILLKVLADRWQNVCRATCTSERAASSGYAATSSSQSRSSSPRLSRHPPRRAIRLPRPPRQRRRSSDCSMPSARADAV